MRPLATARIVSSLPGCLRLRLHRGAGTQQALAAAVEALNANAAVSTAAARWQTSSLLIGTGVAVQQGQVIGTVGCTGRCSGNHLHFEVRRAGSPTDPLAALGG
jgi:hypothetical protein